MTIRSPSKICFKCGKEKSLEEFYKHPQMADGRLGKCKACAREDVSKHRKDNIDLARERDWERNKTEKRRKCLAENSKRWRAENPEKYRAQNKVNNALRCGKIKTNDRCEVCGNSERIHKHHPDYSRPLDVVWLCPVCHAEETKKAVDHFRRCYGIQGV